jgi:hypothetical protein
MVGWTGTEGYNKQYKLPGVQSGIQPAVPNVLIMTIRGCQTVYGR